MSNKIEPVYVIAGILGLDTASKAQSQMILYSCGGIRDMWGFVEYCRAHHAGIQYAKPTQKLDILALRYKRIEFERSKAKEIKNIKEKADVIAQKVCACYEMIIDERWRRMNENIDFKDPIVDGKPLFDEYELLLLERVGNFEHIGYCMREKTLRERLLTCGIGMLEGGVKTIENKG